MPITANTRRMLASSSAVPAPDGAVTLDVQALDLAGARQLLGQFRLCCQGLGIDLGDQVQQRVVQRHFRLVHVGHGAGEPGADLVGLTKF